MKRNLRNNLLLLSAVVSFIGAGVMILSPDEYSLSILFPVTYTVVLVVFIVMVNRREISFASLCFFSFAFLRYTIIPVIGCFTNYYEVDTILITEKSLNTALILMLIELVCASLFLTVLECSQRRQRQVEGSQLALYGSKLGYVIFIALALVVYMTIGRSMNLKISFFMLSAGVERTSDSVGTLVSLVNLLISAALFFVTVIAIYSFKKQYNISNSQRTRRWYVLCSILFVLIPICTIFGERRVSVLNVAVGYIVLLISVYPEHKGKIIKRLSLGAGCIILLMTLYKTLTVFLYESYEEAMNANSMDLIDLACQLDSYFYGIKTVARNVTFASTNSVKISNAIYDIFRNIFGFSFFLKGGLTTSELFNLYKSGGRELTGTLFSSCGYAYCYLGFIGPFIDICVKLGIMIKIEKIIRSTRYYEWKYIWGYVYSILAYSMFGSIVMQINSVTRFLFCHAIFIFCASFFKRKSNKLM